MDLIRQVYYCRFNGFSDGTWAELLEKPLKRFAGTDGGASPA